MIVAKSRSRQAIARNFLGLVPGVVLLFGAVSAHSTEDMLRVYMDQARILKLDRDVSKVIVGNADVADVTVADPRTIVLTGRSYGATNVVLLDAVGNAILDERVLVSVDEANTVRIYKQTERAVLSCAPNCETHIESTGTKSNTSSAVASSSFSNPTSMTNDDNQSSMSTQPPMN